jgi:methyl-accepting chemotaxis protein
MNNQQLIKQIESKITKINNIINNWKQELMKYENTLEEIIKQVSELKTNSKNIK